MSLSTAPLIRIGVPCAAILLTLVGCLATKGVVIESNAKAAAAPPGAASSVTAPSWLPRWMVGPAPGPAPMRDDGKPIAPTIRTQLQCKTPPENYDFMTVITTRYGTEAALRLKRLLSTDFADSSIAAKDRELLKYMAREMLWIPVQVEEKIGSAMLMASSENLSVLDDDELQKPLWDQTAQILRELSAASPPTPFETRLILLQKGSPRSLAGGVIFVDNRMLKSVFESDTPSVAKLRFVLAHELAHIQRRHRAKRIQQLLIDSEAGLKLMRQIISRAQAGGSDFTPAAIGAWIETVTAVQDVAKDLLNYHAKYEQDQEYEADACATALMMEANVGNPLQAFQSYRADVEKFAKAQTAGSDPSANGLTDTHPPNSLREAKIKEKMDEYRAGDRTIGRKEGAFSASAAASAVAARGNGQASKSGSTSARSSGTATLTPPASASNRTGVSTAASTGQVRPSAPAASAVTARR